MHDAFFSQTLNGDVRGLPVLCIITPALEIAVNFNGINDSH